MRRAAPLVLAAAALLAAGGACLTPSTSSRYTATIANSTDTASTDNYFQCSTILASSVDGANALFVWPFGETSGTTVADTSGKGDNGTYAVAPSVDTASSPTKSCPRDTGSPWLLNGSSNFAYFGTQQTNPTTFSLEVWFKTSTIGGKLLGFGSATTGSSGNYDRHLYINSSGLLVFGIYNGACYTISTGSSVADGKWHQAVATLAPSGTYAGMRLYLDGSLVASDTTHATPQNFNGYWRVGYDNIGSWPNSPSNYYFTGDLRYASVYSVVLTPTQVLKHYGAGAGS